uniref:Uncharacterized protein n=1 Tax=Leersia perrieri TaxID=77586 RepID=A0A0D9XNJ4_9ORYZ
MALFSRPYSAFRTLGSTQKKNSIAAFLSRRLESLQRYGGRLSPKADALERNPRRPRRPGFLWRLSANNHALEMHHVFGDSVQNNDETHDHRTIYVWLDLKTEYIFTKC